MDTNDAPSFKEWQNKRVVSSMIKEASEWGSRNNNTRHSKIVTFVTITLKPRLYKYSFNTQYELSQREIAHMLTIHSNDFVMVAEATKSGNVHFHAIIIADDIYHQVTIINKFKKDKNLGFIHIKEVNSDLSPIINYMLKDIHETYKLITNINKCYAICFKKDNLGII